MLKFLFLDERDVELVTGFERKLVVPRKHPGSPLFRPDAPWENGMMSMYGSVIQRPDGLFQCWYSIHPKGMHGALAYIESDDGINWRRPALDIFRYKGKKTNVVFTWNPHGATVYYDAADPRPDWRYKLMCGASPFGKISVYRGPDGIQWQPAYENPAIHSNPDCPMSLHRQIDGRYVAYHRPGFGDRRVGRSESWDFQYWTPAKMVLEPGPGDPAQLQFYGMGAAQYGAYEIGTVWMYHTVLEDHGLSKMKGYQEVELTYSRSGYAWHRAAQGTPFIPHGKPGSWEQGNLQCASSPVFGRDEVRFYYAACTSFHGNAWEDKVHDAGLGMASTQPDRFVGLHAGVKPGQIVSTIFWIHSPEVFVNADIAKDGRIDLELLDDEWKPLPGFTAKPITGNGTALPVIWEGQPDLNTIVNKPIRFRLQARKAKVYSVFMNDGDTDPIYHRFGVRSYIAMDLVEKPKPQWW